MEQLKNAVVFETKNNVLEIQNFEAVKAEIAKGLNKNYKVSIIQSKEDYKAQKESRAELNKIAKEINDNKIAWVNDLTAKVKEQTKEICELIKAKASEFDNSIKNYESEVNELLGIQTKEKAKFELTIKFTSKEDLDNFIKKLPKKLEYSVKEK